MSMWWIFLVNLQHIAKDVQIREIKIYLSQNGGRQVQCYLFHICLHNMKYVLPFQRLILKSIPQLTVLLKVYFPAHRARRSLISLKQCLHCIFFFLIFISLLDCVKPFPSYGQEQHEDFGAGFTTLFFFY